jgi:multidrug efflux pump subunit AcrA (membrane-fusion protein)
MYGVKTLNRQLATLLALAILTVGCKNGANDDQTVEKKPRPVEIKTLRISAPPNSSLVSASVASWKTEQIGMEVSGRIEWVVEPNTDIEGRIVGRDGKVIVEGDPIARIDDEKYRLQVETAKAQQAQTGQQIEGATTELEKSIPAQIRAAEADKKLASTEFERSKRLFQQNAGAQADVDSDEAKYESSISKIEQLESMQKAKQAELESLRFQLLQREKAVRDAEKNLADCTLYSSFRGQISDVDVVPGSVVSQGQAVATIQMMDPIKVEVEVSSEDSRRLRNRQRIPVLVNRSDGSVTEEDGYLYLVDGVADPQTRTFSLTLLVMNERYQDGDDEDLNLATTDQTWRLDFEFLPGAENGKYYAIEPAICEDDEGAYLWRVNNFNLHEGIPADRKLKVSKLRIKRGASRLPFLGNWIFQEVEILDDDFDSKTDLIAGRLNVTDGDPNDWNGDTILIQDSGQWMLRPGDLVKVDLSDNSAKPGMFVPMDAISYSQGKTFLFLIEEGEKTTVKKTEILIADADQVATTSSRLRVEPIDANVKLEGQKYVTRGSHYLRDGEPVSVISVGAKR